MGESDAHGRGCLNNIHPNDLLQFSSAAEGHLTPVQSSGSLALRPLSDATRRKGLGAEHDEAGKHIFFWERLRWAAPCLSFCSCALFYYPLRRPPRSLFRSRLLATAHEDCRIQGLNWNLINPITRFSLPCPVSPHQQRVAALV